MAFGGFSIPASNFLWTHALGVSAAKSSSAVETRGFFFSLEHRPPVTSSHKVETLTPALCSIMSLGFLSLRYEGLLQIPADVLAEALIPSLCGSECVQDCPSPTRAPCFFPRSQGQQVVSGQWLCLCPAPSPQRGTTLPCGAILAQEVHLLSQFHGGEVPKNALNKSLHANLILESAPQETNVSKGLKLKRKDQCPVETWAQDINGAIHREGSTKGPQPDW